MTTALLDLSVVLYHPDPELLARSLDTIAAATGRLAESAGVQTRLWIIDNGAPEGSDAGSNPFRVLLDRYAAPGRPPAMLIAGHGNVGYGAGHNLAIRQGDAPYHLILNYDILLEADALLAGWRYMEAHPRTVLLTPKVFSPSGEQEFLCKRRPTVLDLGLRAFAPTAVKRLFAKRLDRYEMRDVTRDAIVTGLEQVSGAFMLFRREALARLGGFDDGYFLYFEDFDLSRRAMALGEIAYVPDVRMVHFGGKAARKGGAHIRMFARSALRFFNTHGWRLV
ncbi:glycosyl transferase [Azospirillum sp. TSH100]|uniref:glycosyltransferase family 2 protein n=1 Tax=Azospirillum sp. TSH100 TaxID=652764 RepID=UPI000D6143E2|nr:glycosyltransferase family 2 protein [Azospirillum sp. TSH100]PWC81197.1 glycosyl transferase [Azospirillum sp. TSH100]QCG86429.1 glycosyltransferase family 2 protein [Azospirillum sp. TSH100]